MSLITFTVTKLLLDMKTLVYFFIA